MVRFIGCPFGPGWERKRKTVGERRKKGLYPEEAAFFTVILRASPAIRRATSLRQTNKNPKTRTEIANLPKRRPLFGIGEMVTPAHAELGTQRNKADR